MQLSLQSSICTYQFDSRPTWDKFSGHFSIILNYHPGDHDHGHHDHDHGAGHHDHSSGGPPPAPAFAPPAPLGYTTGSGTGFGSDSYSSPGSVDSYDAPVAPNAYDEPFTNFVQVNLRLVSLLKRLFILFNMILSCYVVSLFAALWFGLHCQFRRHFCQFCQFCGNK